MKKQSWAKLLSEIEEYCRSTGLTRKNMAEQLGIPYNTYRKWFQKKERFGSLTYVQKIDNFLKSKKESQYFWKELWTKILNWWETQHQYSTIRELSDKVGWETQSLSEHFLNKVLPPKLVIEKIADIIGLKASSAVSIEQEVQIRAEKIKYLLIFLEEELRWFRDGSEETRSMLREELDLDDIGYISSLLTMLGDEGRFKRWLALTTNRFNFFKKKGGKDEKSPN